MRRTGARVLAALGLTIGLGVAFAQSQGDAPPAKADYIAPSTPTGMAAGLRELADDLSARERSLDRREASIEAREADLAVIEARLEERMASLETLRGEIRTMLEGMDTAQEARITDLVRKVEVMRPKQAGDVLASTEPVLAVEVLRRMSPSKAGKALAAMPPPLAATLAEQMAARDEVGK